ncbi:hypothetical protein AB0B42_00430 [Streptomyces fradiae]|uniref:hypothetical protein n=1 Tax=Streptomyces fradiae TaxID=1906 RepID=UPI0033DD9252
MNARRVNAAAGVVHAAMKQRETAAGIAAALEAAGLLQSPESAVELTRRRSEDLALRVELAPMGGPRAVPMELGESLLPAVRWLVARVAELEAERHSTNEALSDAAEALRANRDRIAVLEAEAVCQSRMTTSRGVSRCVLPVRHRNDHHDPSRNHHWSDEFADEAPRPARESLLTHTGCGMPLTRRLECGHCPHEVCEDCDRCPCSCKCTSAAAPLPQTAAEVLAERSTPWVGDLPAGPVLCRCGHTGADHHHAGRSCGAMLPRRLAPGSGVTA